MKTTLTILFCIYALLAFGQKTKVVTKKYENPWYTEKYSVLKSDKSIKHGSFQKLRYENCVVIDGYYKHGVQDSLWTTYYWRSKQIKKQGSFKDGVRIGKWNFYTSNGELTQTYNFTTKNVEFSPTPSKPTKILQDGIETSKVLISRPSFIGSSIELYDYITPEQMEMSKSGEYDLKTGMVAISFYISTEGKAFDHQIQSGLSPKIDNKCLELVKNIPDLWIPGKDQNGNVVSMYTLYVSFKIH